MEQRFKVGEIADTHGIRGEVKVYPTTDDAKRFRQLEECTLDTGSGQIPLHVQNCKFFKQFVILKFKEYDNINQVEPYKHCALYVDREHAVALAEDEYYVADLVGLTVTCEDGTELGTLSDVIKTGANDVYVVALKEPRGSKKEVLIPALKECILEIDVEHGHMRVHLLDGLMDL
jgi:16S rRNA processing protein RimM